VQQKLKKTYRYLTEDFLKLFASRFELMLMNMRMCCGSVKLDILEESTKIRANVVECPD